MDFQRIVVSGFGAAHPTAQPLSSGLDQRLNVPRCSSAADLEVALASGQVTGSGLDHRAREMPSTSAAGCQAPLVVDRSAWVTCHRGSRPGRSRQVAPWSTATGRRDAARGRGSVGRAVGHVPCQRGRVPVAPRRRSAQGLRPTDDNAVLASMSAGVEVHARPGPRELGRAVEAARGLPTGLAPAWQVAGRASPPRPVVLLPGRARARTGRCLPGPMTRCPGSPRQASSTADPSTSAPARPRRRRPRRPVQAGCPTRAGREAAMGSCSPCPSRTTLCPRNGAHRDRLGRRLNLARSGGRPRRRARCRGRAGPRPERLARRQCRQVPAALSGRVVPRVRRAARSRPAPRARARTGSRGARGWAGPSLRAAARLRRHRARAWAGGPR